MLQHRREDAFGYRLLGGRPLAPLGGKGRIGDMSPLIHQFVHSTVAHSVSVEERLLIPTSAGELTRTSRRLPVPHDGVARFIGSPPLLYTISLKNVDKRFPLSSPQAISRRRLVAGGVHGRKRQ